MQSIIVILVKLHRHLLLFCLFAFSLLFSEQAEGPKPSWHWALARKVGLGHGQWEQPTNQGHQRTWDSHVGEEDTV